ncbi:MAG TPA: protein kinase [Polyangia bacterium]|nr:protein kinase [Polyangia bacterium]
MADCPSEQTIVDFLDGKLAPAKGAEVHRHVDRCAACRALLASLAPSINRSTIDERDDTHAPDDPLGAEHRTAPLTEAPDHAAASAAVAKVVASVLPLVPVDRYDVRDEFARGGLGRIFRAHDRRLGRPVAVKQLIAGGSEAARRFIREALITARLQHPAIVPIYEAGRWPSGEPFYAMKLVSGRSLDQVVKGKSLADRLTLLPNIIAVAEAMAYAHSQRIIHRDLKPGNVLVGSFGETVLIDWGLAKDLSSGTEVAPDAMMTPYHDDSTEAGTVLGTPTYMPPEQAEGKPVDERADVYAIGAILYHVLAGAPPYSGGSSAETLARVLSEPPPPLSSRESGVPRDLVTVVEKAMARDPAGRYPSAKELADDLVRFQAGQLVSAHHYSPLEMARRWVQRRRAPVSVAVALLTALAFTGVLAVSRIAHERDRARSERAEARAAQAQAEKRESELVLAQAQQSLDDDPTAAVAWLKQYPDTGDWRAAQAIFGDALSRGVATRVWSGVSRAAFSPDGQLATWGVDGAVRLWSPDGKTATLGQVGDARVREVLFAPGGAGIVVQRIDESIELWDPRTLAPKPLHRRAASYDHVHLSPDGKWLGAVADDGSVDLWSLPDGAPRPLADARAHATTMSFLRDGKVAVGSQDHHVRVYDIESGAARIVATHPTQVARVRASPDGRRLVSSDPLNVTFVSDLKTGASHKFVGRAEQGRVVSEFAPDGTVALALGGGALVLVDPDTGATRSLRGHTTQVTQARFLPDGKRLVSGAEDGVVRVWDVASGESIPLVGHAAEITSVDVSPDGTLVATGSADKSVRLWTLGGAPRVVRHPETELYAVAFSTDGARVAVGGAGGFVEACDTATLGCRTLAGPRGEVESILFLRDGRLLSGSFDATVHLWDATGKPLASYAGQEPIWSLAASPDGTRVAFTAAERSLVTVELAGGARKEAKSDGPLSSWDVAFSPDGKLVAVGEGADVRVWDWAAGTSKLLRGQTGLVQHVAFAPSGTRLAAASADTTVALWDLDSGTPRLLRGHTNGVKLVAFSPDGGTLASSGLDGSVRLWRVSDGSSRVLLGHRGAVPCAVFSPDGRMLVSAGDDHTVRLWDTATGESRVVRGHDRAVRAVAFAPDGKSIASVGRDGTLQLVRLSDLAQPLFGGHDARTLRPQLDHATTAVIGSDDRPTSVLKN